MARKLSITPWALPCLQKSRWEIQLECSTALY